VTVLVETQLTLAGEEITLVDGKPLTERQQLAWDTIRHRDGGATSDEIGALMHDLRGRHLAGNRCHWCAQEGRGVLTSAALRPLVKRKKNGQWVPRATVEPGDAPPIVAPAETASPDDDGSFDWFMRHGAGGTSSAGYNRARRAS
jgi:hypothetical protein